MLNFDKVKSLQPSLQKNTDEYLDRFFQGILDKLYNDYVELENEKVTFYHSLSFQAKNFDEGFLLEIDPDSLMRNVTFIMKFHTSGNLTIEELSAKLDRTLSYDLAGKGHLYASYCLEKGVDPYLAVAISMEETGCKWGCSRLVKTCNNVGGMKGSGCGSYGYFNTIDDGIKAFIDNIERNYVAYGLTTAEAMNPKYAENPMWSRNVNNYIEKIRNS